VYEPSIDAGEAADRRSTFRSAVARELERAAG
jgi:hypothetical protein